jgi:hypothetical protein
VTTVETEKETAALTTLLDLEYAVIYGLAAGGGQLATQPAGEGTPLATAIAATTAAYDQHRLRRDRLIADLQARHVPVPVPLPAYRVTRSSQPAELLGFLAGIAQSTIVGYRSALGDLSDAAFRGDAVGAIIETARYRTTVLLAAGQADALAAPAIPG